MTITKKQLTAAEVAEPFRRDGITVHTGPIFDERQRDEIRASAEEGLLTPEEAERLLRIPS